jgi:ankyrin repeat protein
MQPPKGKKIQKTKPSRDYNQIQELVLECTTINLNEKDEQGFTPLYRSVESQNFKIAKLLLELGVFF